MTRIYEQVSFSSNTESTNTSPWLETRLEKGKPNYTELRARFHSFIDTPYEDWVVKPLDFAAAGFYYTGLKDIARCIYCQIVLKQWEITDFYNYNTFWEHYHWSKNCPFVHEMILELIAERSHPVTVESVSNLLKIPEAFPEKYPTSEDESPIDYLMRLYSKMNENGSKPTNPCKVCFDKPAEVLFTPCKHLACCKQCADLQGVCCICKGDIEGTIIV